MSYTKTTWQNLPNQTTPVNATNLNKIENELEKLDPATPYTQTSGRYTTAAWDDGTTTVSWVAPKTGLYLLLTRFFIDDDSKAQIYKQFQLKGTATRVTGDVLCYQPGPSSSNSGAYGLAIFSACSLISATQGQTIVPRIWTPTANIIWDVTFTGLFLK